MKERRVLILVNGENNAATLQQLSLCENIEEILQNLLRLEFIKPVADAINTAGATREVASGETVTDEEVDPREFMCNTLLTFGNRVRVAQLIEQINETDDLEALKVLVKPWYQAVSETPGGMYQADDLRKDLLKMLQT